MINFIFMLTQNDRTVDNAMEVLESLRDSGLRYVGFKDVGATPERQREIAAAAHRLGMEVMLEVVSTSVEDEMASLRAAVAADVDWVLGGTNPEQGVGILPRTIKYCPFPGTVLGHPSVLSGEISAIAEHAKQITAIEGVYGVDLLAYRHATADHFELTKAVVEAGAGPVIAAGSVIGREQIETLAAAGAWGFTIGSAIFENKLPSGPSVAGQVEAVLEIAKNA